MEIEKTEENRQSLSCPQRYRNRKGKVKELWSSRFTMIELAGPGNSSL
jgi:hypothetical protein